jgi:hypothetical protein
MLGISMRVVVTPSEAVYPAVAVPVKVADLIIAIEYRVDGEALTPRGAAMRGAGMPEVAAVKTLMKPLDVANPGM